MSAKNRDNKNRWRNITVGFRVSPEENELINKAVALSGLPKCLLLHNGQIREINMEEVDREEIAKILSEGE